MQGQPGHWVEFLAGGVTMATREVQEAGTVLVVHLYRPLPGEQSVLVPKLHPLE